MAATCSFSWFASWIARADSDCPVEFAQAATAVCQGRADRAAQACWSWLSTEVPLNLMLGRRSYYMSELVQFDPGSPYKKRYSFFKYDGGRPHIVAAAEAAEPYRMPRSRSACAMQAMFLGGFLLLVPQHQVPESYIDRKVMKRFNTWFMLLPNGCEFIGVFCVRILATFASWKEPKR
eukprot:g7636.t1